MKKHRLVAVAALALALWSPVSVFADEEITVDVVIEWLHKGIPEYWIIKHFKKQEAVFHLTTTDEKRLQDAGATPDLIKAMLDTAKGKKEETPPPPPQQKPPDPPPQPPKPPDKPVPPVPPPQRDVPLPPPPQAPSHVHGLGTPKPEPPPPVPQTPSDSIHYRHPWGAFELDYPHGWKVTTIRNGKNSLSAKHFEVGFVPDAEPEDLDKAEQYFKVMFARKNWTGDPPTLESWEQEYREAVKNQGTSLTRSHSTQLDGKAALEMYVTGAPKGNAQPSKVILYMVIAPEGRYAIAFGATADKREAAAAALTQMINSFHWGRFEEQPVDPGLFAPRDEEVGKEMVPFVEPDGRFELKFPSPWNVSKHALPGVGNARAWQAYYFSRSKYDPSAGLPFSFGVMVMVQPTVDPSRASSAGLVAASKEISAWFEGTQQAAGIAAHVGDPEAFPFGGMASVKILYTLVYPSGDEEVGYLIVAATRDATFVVEANTPKAEFNRYQKVLSSIVESFRMIQGGAVATSEPQASIAKTQQPAHDEAASAVTEETPQGDPAEAFAKWRDAMTQRNVEVLWALRSNRLKADMEKKAETARRMVMNASPSERDQILSDLGLSSDKIDTLVGKDFFRQHVERKYPPEVVGAASSLTVNGKAEVQKGHATLNVLRKDMGSGKVSLIYEEGQWRIDTDY